MFRKTPLILLTVGISVGVMTLIEEGFQAFLFSDVQLFQKLRDPGFYVNGRDEDDYWILHYWFSGSKKRPTAKAHPLLGWIGDFSRDTFRHHATDEIGDRVPVLLYGDSFAGCHGLTNERCFQGILNSDKTFSRDYFLLNYGAGGYGLDQIFLLLKQSIEYYAKNQKEDTSN